MATSIYLNFFLGGLPHAWSSPCLGPGLRSGLKPPLLQQAAFDELIFRVDVMRNVATRENNADNSNLKIKKWSSMPSIALNSISSQEEEIQEVAGRLEIRVVPKDTKNDDNVTPVKITNEVSTKPLIRDRKAELIEQEVKNNSNHGSKESITENTVQKQTENVINEIANIVQKIDSLNLDKNLEQIHCVLNVEKYELTNEVPQKSTNDLTDKDKNVPDVDLLKMNGTEISPKEFLVNENEKDIEEIPINKIELSNEEHIPEKKSETIPKPEIQENNVKILPKEEVKKCSPCIDLTSHPGVIFVSGNSNTQPEIPTR